MLEEIGDFVVGKVEVAVLRERQRLSAGGWLAALALIAATGGCGYLLLMTILTPALMIPILMVWLGCVMICATGIIVGRVRSYVVMVKSGGSVPLLQATAPTQPALPDAGNDPVTREMLGVIYPQR